MFILKEKVAHFLENLPLYPTGGNGQFPNAEKVIDSYCSVLPGPDRTWFRDVREMIALINDNPFDFNLNVNWIRNELNIPPKMYTQKFYFFTRMQVTEYIRWHRLVMAKYLLSHSSLKVETLLCWLDTTRLPLSPRRLRRMWVLLRRCIGQPIRRTPPEVLFNRISYQKTKAVAAEGGSLKRKSPPG